MSRAPTWWKWFPWSLASIMIVLSWIVLVQNSGRNFPPTTLYGWFPIIGIWTWSLMWTHYAVGEVRRINQKLVKNILYSKISGLLVLAGLLLHPGLLVIAQYQSGAGLPPGSIYSYVGPSGRVAVTLGAIALVLFLSYEVFERLQYKPTIKKNWWLVNIAQSIAMLFILKHSFTIGSHIQFGWFRMYWIVLGTLLLPMLAHVHWNDWKNRKN